LASRETVDYLKQEKGFDFIEEIPEYQEIQLGDFKVKRIPVLHSIRCPTSIYKIETDDGVLVYAPDVAGLTQRAQNELVNINLYISGGNALDKDLVWFNKQKKEIVGHISIAKILSYLRDLSVENLIITHLGEELIKLSDEEIEKKVEDIAEEKGYLGNIYVAKDNDVFNLVKNNIKKASLLVEDFDVLYSPFYKTPLTTSEIYRYYKENVDKILEEIKGRRVYIRYIIQPYQTIVVRHKPGTFDSIVINTIEDFEKWNNGQNIEFIWTVNDEDEWYIIDLDGAARGFLDWLRINEVVYHLYQLFERQPEVDKVIVKFSGNRGYHILAHIKKDEFLRYYAPDLKSLTLDVIRNHLIDLLNNEIINNKVINKLNDIKLMQAVNKGQMRLALLNLVQGRGIKASWSLDFNTGLISKPIPKEEILSFLPYKAAIDFKEKEKGDEVNWIKY